MRDIFEKQRVGNSFVEVVGVEGTHFALLKRSGVVQGVVGEWFLGVKEGGDN